MKFVWKVLGEDKFSICVGKVWEGMYLAKKVWYDYRENDFARSILHKGKD